MGSIQLIHMERPDPGALTLKQLWRAWVEAPTRGTGIVVTEEMVEGGRFHRTEIGTEVMIDPDPVLHLQHLIEAKEKEGWVKSLVSFEERYGDDPARLEIFYEFKVPAGKQSEFIFRLDQLLATVKDGLVADWVNPREVVNLRKAPDVARWDTELQIGRDRIKVQVGQWKQIVISAKVPWESDADVFLTTLAVGKDLGFSVTMTNGDATSLDPTDAFCWFMNRCGWVEDLACEIGAKPKPLKAEPLITSDGMEFAPVLF